MKDALHKLATEWDKSLHLPGPTYWKLEGLTDPQAFFLHLPMVFPYGMTLLFEDIEMSLTAKSLYAEHPAIYTKKVACDTISPVPESFHVAFSPEFANGLCQLIVSQGFEGTFYHFKGYSQNEVVFTFHDVFMGELVLSNRLPKATVIKFASALGSTAELATYAIDHRHRSWR